MKMKIQNYNPLDDGHYRFVLNNIEEKETIYGKRLMWLFEELEQGAEVVGFTSLSTSTQANAYRWALALNPEIQNQRTWTEEDVVGRECCLKVEIVQGSKGPKNKIIEVLPIKE
jgi:hypothetical protein